jgi:hypothetical protein
MKKTKVMSLVEGETGTGKSRSLKNLNPERTLILNTECKALPFRSKFQWDMHITNPYVVIWVLDILRTPKDKRKPQPNNMVYNKILQKFEKVDQSDFDVIVVDSFSAWQMNLLQSIKASHTGFEIWGKYADYIKSFFDNLKQMDCHTFCFGHTEFNTNADGETVRTCKVKGKEWEGVVEREFTCVFFSEVISEDNGTKYRFLTNRDGGSRPAKTPEEMFPLHIENDLASIVKTFEEYYQ